jgi:hypothetical protein
MSTKKKTIYIAGPMTGLPEYNKPAFDEAARHWKETRVVINPARNYGGDQTLTHAQYMRYSIHQLLIVDAVYMLKGWQDSKGATAEHTIAKSLGLEIYYEN